MQISTENKVTKHRLQQKQQTIKTFFKYLMKNVISWNILTFFAFLYFAIHLGQSYPIFSHSLPNTHSYTYENIPFVLTFSQPFVFFHFHFLWNRIKIRSIQMLRLYHYIRQMSEKNGTHKLCWGSEKLKRYSAAFVCLLLYAYYQPTRLSNCIFFWIFKA